MTLTLLVAASCSIVRPSHAAEPPDTTPDLHASSPALDRAVRELQTVDLDGRPWRFEHLLGRVVLIDFWATWCAPCLAELPRLRILRGRYGALGFEVLGVSLDVRDRRSLVAWLQRHGIAWPQVHDGRGRAGVLPRRFGVVGIPRSVLVDHTGRVGGVDLRGDALERRVVALLAERNAARRDEPQVRSAPAGPPGRR